MADARRYYCNIRVDTTFNAGNLPKQNMQALNENIENAIEEWVMEMGKKGIETNVCWDWCEHCDLG